MIRNKIIEFMKKEHTIKLNWKAKFVLGVIIILILFYLIPFMFITEEIEGFNDELFLICTHSGLYSCEDLERAYYNCNSARNWFDLKNCTFSNNQSEAWLEKILKIK